MNVLPVPPEPSTKKIPDSHNVGGFKVKSLTIFFTHVLFLREFFAHVYY